MSFVFRRFRVLGVLELSRVEGEQVAVGVKGTCHFRALAGQPRARRRSLAASLFNLGVPPYTTVLNKDL